MSDDEVDVGHVYRSLKSSTLRQEVFNLVCKCPDEISTEEIAIQLKRRERDVRGAITGNNRFKIDECLAVL